VPVRSRPAVPDRFDLSADVLVIGGGPAATWAAVKARARGATVVLVDKGHCGTSGATAAAGTGVWYVPPVAAARDEAMASRAGLGGHLADRRWMGRVLEETWDRLPELGSWGYPYPVNDAGEPQRGSLQGPEYMRRMRRQVLRMGATVLDHSPATELLVDGDGAVAGAHGVNRQTGAPWTVRAGAVVLATGGCAFLSKALGTDVDTGDGALLAAELGADLSGMEFSNAYGLAPAGTSVTKSAFYSWGTFYREDGSVLEGAGSQRGRSLIARHLLTGERVLCRLDQADASTQAAMRRAQPNFFQTFDRLGVDPFTQRFPVTLILEGTVRGTGGIRIHGDDCATSVPGLYAAGDAATRELICGGFTGGGSHNAAWAIASGSWAGAGAARFALRLGTRASTRTARRAGTAGLRPTGTPGAFDEYRDVVRAVREEVVPYDRNLFRTGDGLRASLTRLDDTWVRVRSGLHGTGARTAKVREAVALVAHARWMYASALARTESRGMHKRSDFPDLDPAQAHRIVSGGLDEVWARPEPAVAVAGAPAASVAEVMAVAAS
jgi:succinate dehydrogenase/fumarate reductase flavoprotein subunit